MLFDTCAVKKQGTLTDCKPLETIILFVQDAVSLGVLYTPRNKIEVVIRAGNKLWTLK